DRRAELVRHEGHEAVAGGAAGGAGGGRVHALGRPPPGPGVWVLAPDSYAAVDGMYGGPDPPHAPVAGPNPRGPQAIPTVAGSGIRPSEPGSGKPGTPWLRTQRANLIAVAITRCCWA